jgi:hypothetical protein
MESGFLYWTDIEIILMNRTKIYSIKALLFVLLAIALTMTVMIFMRNHKTYPSKGNESKILSTLSKVHVEFSTDGAGGSTLTSNDKIRNLVFTYDDDILAVLIDNLANTEPTSSLVDGNENVPLGYVCFDLLCTLVKKTDDWFSFCGDDGLWACVRKDYFTPIANDEWNQGVAIAAQKHWLSLYEAGKLKIDRQYFNEKEE